MRFSPSKCKAMFQDVDFNTPLKLQGEYSRLWSSLHTWAVVSSDSSLSYEIDARISKPRIASANLRHLWRQKGVSLILKGSVHRTTVRLFYSMAVRHGLFE